MKKLMILAAVAMSMVAANAATMKWQLVGVKTPGEDGAQTGTAIGKTTAGVSLNVWAIESAISGDVWAAVAKKGEDGFYTVSKPSGAADTTASWKSTTGTFTDPGDYGVGDTAYGLTVLTYDVDGDGKIGAGDFYFTAQGSYEFTAASGKSLSLASSTSGSWTKIAGSTPTPTPTPEPTSGLLLALGMAGLALRRRRA